MNLTAIIAAIGIAIGTGLGWQLQAGRIASIQLELQNEQLDRANERIAIQRASRNTIERNMSAVTAAQDAAATRNDRLAADLQRSRNELGRLQDASATAMRNASAGLAACTSTLATHSKLLGQCAERYSAVAGDADQWVSGLILWQEAWPK